MSQYTAQNPIAYFCAEFGIDSHLPLYAGGLGVLAGDTVKEAADQGLPFVAVGLMYRGENAIQEITSDGMQQEKDLDVDPLSLGFEHVYVDDMPLFIKVHLTTIDVWARCWKKTLKNGVTLYLLDTETDQNLKQERVITHALYSGTEESLLKQQLILGIGGVKLLHALDIYPNLYHINEGRPAFLHWQLIRTYMDTHGLSYEEARDKAKSKTVYTNHTLVAAGNESYNVNLLKTYGLYYAEKMGISIDKLLEPGIEDNPEKFNMTRFALNVSCKASGVSLPHYELSKKQWPEYQWHHITNGVHFPTWQDQEMRACDKDGNCIWTVHQRNKKDLREYIQKTTGFAYDENRMVISWARRMAGYKRPQEIFDDINRLKNILTNLQYPVQILISGKAHAKDTQAKMFLQEMIHHMQHELSGYVLYIPNYNMEVAQYLVRGSDVWLNTPTKGMEASGTSGMKAAANGVLQCTVRDGWTEEVDWYGIGWDLDPNHLSSSFYHLLESDIVPKFYQRDENGVPQAWLERMKKTLTMALQYSATRMMNEYKQKLYNL
ncbi:hypothetical protein COX08_04465 [Candidatus Beckwithbacteria bacterium CG23_combo_of_CG06-09_8_20_14_all_34_8]|uniref:Alpha-glucan phosphorylase n=1 Tax=Candidatus Beckwithbacteria bacterium CG23_combo_of_CG06-09_8_20_14_all_34_8 TaxID=1974497 RepID=A0A2H0B574_9BACT|nr:MAG: hypothetical protein COX08_04465 [Candidatus Beckwithbacteria bacterium CG23_combo_of_CG06-09_8_20_14_all_34_8]